MGWRPRKILAADCETDPFQHGRIPQPFLWGLYDGKTFRHFDSTAEFVAVVRERHAIVYAHNGGKFDFMYLIPYLGATKAQIINGRIVSLMLGKAELRDSYAAVPEALGNIQKKKIDIWKLEPACRAQYINEIIEYNKWDCIYLYDLMKRYREIAGTHATIASNALTFSRRLGIDIGKTNHSFDSNYRPFYFGGRCECFQPGTYNGAQILDIHSAYPYAMTFEHPTGISVNRRSTLDGMTDEQIQRSFIQIECTSHGAFPIRSKAGLIFPHEYNEFCISGWEYLVARDFGLIDNVNRISVREFEKTINFKSYVDHWFAYKHAHPKKQFPIEYTIGKIMANSLYGKTAQNPVNYFDYEIKPGGTRVDKEHGWELYTEFDKLELHRRPSLWKYKHHVNHATGEVSHTGNAWEAARIYKNVATGASITGFTRAHLLRAIHTVGLKHVIYVDTDSLILTSAADPSKLPLSDALGDWGIEESNAPVLHAAGKKLYAARLSNGEEKVACKGSRLTFNDLELIVNGNKIVWENPAPTFSLASGPRFIVREITATHPALRQTRVTP